MGLAIFSKVTTGLGKILSVRGNFDGRLEVVLNGNFAIVDPVALTTSLVAIYTVPGNKKVRIWIEFANASATSNSDVDAYLVPHGDAEGTQNQILESTVIPFASVGIRLGPYGLGPGDFLSAKANANNSITIFMYVEEFDV